MSKKIKEGGFLAVKLKERVPESDKIDLALESEDSLRATDLPRAVVNIVGFDSSGSISFEHPFHQTIIYLFNLPHHMNNQSTEKKRITSEQEIRHGR